MSVCNWLARALPTAQVTKWVFAGTWEIDDITDVTINGKTVSTVTGSTAIATLLTTLATALEASNIPEFAEIAWTSDSTHLIATGNTPGLPFAVVVSTRDAGGAADAQTIDGATTSPGVDSTACTGPNDWANVNNWSGGAVPVSTDTVNVDLALGSVLYGLNQSAVTLTALNFFATRQTQNGVGLSATNAAGYTEYRDQSLAISATNSFADIPNIGRFKVNFGSVATTFEGRNIGQSTDTGIPAGCIKGTSTSNSFEFKNGSWGLAFFEGEAAAYASLIVGPTASVICGPGVSTQTMFSTLGSLLLQSAFTTGKQFGGQLKFVGTGTAGSLTATGGTLLYESSGTATAVTIGNAICDLSGDGTGKTFTDLTLNAGGRINDPRKVLTVTNKVTIGTDVYSYSASGSTSQGI